MGKNEARIKRWLDNLRIYACLGPQGEQVDHSRYSQRTPFAFAHTPRRGVPGTFPSCLKLGHAGMCGSHAYSVSRKD